MKFSNEIVDIEWKKQQSNEQTRNRVIIEGTWTLRTDGLEYECYVRRKFKKRTVYTVRRIIRKCAYFYWISLIRATQQANWSTCVSIHMVWVYACIRKPSRLCETCSCTIKRCTKRYTSANICICSAPLFPLPHNTLTTLPYNTIQSCLMYLSCIAKIAPTLPAASSFFLLFYSSMALVQ